MVNVGKFSHTWILWGEKIQYAILAKKAFIDLPRSGVNQKTQIESIGEGKIFTVYTSEVEQFAPEKLPSQKDRLRTIHFQRRTAELQVGKFSRQVHT